MRREQPGLRLQSLKRHVYFPCWYVPRTGPAENACLSLSLRPHGPALTWRCPHLARSPQGGSVPGLARSTRAGSSVHAFMPKGSLLGWLRVGRADPGHVVRRGSTLLVRVRCGAAADIGVTSERQGLSGCVTGETGGVGPSPMASGCVYSPPPYGENVGPDAVIRCQISCFLCAPLVPPAQLGLRRHFPRRNPREQTHVGANASARGLDRPSMTDTDGRAG